jgi:hypothetical protein
MLYIENVLKQFNYYKELGEKTFAQLEVNDLNYKPSLESNSIAIIIQHLSGNMLSRWTDFLNTDGEKEWRNRDAEFEYNRTTKEQTLTLWNNGWKCLFNALKSIEEADLNKIIYIRNLGLTVQDAINRQLCHYSYHVGQIVFIGKLIKDTNWTNLSIPKNASNSYNKELFSKEKSIKHFNDKEDK